MGRSERSSDELAVRAQIGGHALCSCLNASPLAAARDMHQAGAVASQNPLVFAMVAFNCSVWCLYGVVLRNWFPLVAANLVGVTSGTYALLIFCKVEKMCKEAEKEKGKEGTSLHGVKLLRALVAAVAITVVLCWKPIVHGSMLRIRMRHVGKVRMLCKHRHVRFAIGDRENCIQHTLLVLYITSDDAPLRSSVCLPA